MHKFLQLQHIFTNSSLKSSKVKITAPFKMFWKKRMSLRIPVISLRQKRNHFLICSVARGAFEFFALCSSQNADFMTKALQPLVFGSQEKNLTRLQSCLSCCNSLHKCNKIQSKLFVSIMINVVIFPQICNRILSIFCVPRVSTISKINFHT